MALLLNLKSLDGVDSKSWENLLKCVFFPLLIVGQIFQGHVDSTEISVNFKIVLFHLAQPFYPGPGWSELWAYTGNIYTVAYSLRFVDT